MTIPELILALQAATGPRRELDAEIDAICRIGSDFMENWAWDRFPVWRAGPDESSGWFSHGRALNIDKLKSLRLDIDDYSGTKLGDAIRAYHDPLSAYMDRMDFPFLLHSHLRELL